MAYFLLEYELSGDYLERRPAYRADHLALAREAVERGELVLAGALSDPADRAVLLWNVADPGEIENFVKRDPYVREGLVKEWTVRAWTVVIGAGAERVDPPV